MADHDDFMDEFTAAVAEISVRAGEERAARYGANEEVGRDAEALTQERRQTHGDWRQQAAMANLLKNDMRHAPNWGRLPPSRQEALDMIATKLSRILTGDPNEPDHWDDIGGYARLGRDDGHTA